MRPAAKVGLVAVGYVAAFVVASAVVAVYIASTSGPDRQASGSMYAFGDSLLFLAVFAMAAVPGSGAALFFLRPYPAFWRALSAAALAVAATGAAASIFYLAAHTADAGSILHSWSPLAVLRILVSPPVALALLVAGLFAPNRSFRIALFAATLIEVAAFACVALTWFHPFGMQ